MYQKVLLLISYAVTTKLIGYVVLSKVYQKFISPTERRATRVRENVSLNSKSWHSKIAKFYVRTLREREIHTTSQFQNCYSLEFESRKSANNLKLYKYCVVLLLSVFVNLLLLNPVLKCISLILVVFYSILNCFVIINLSFSKIQNQFQ